MTDRPKAHMVKVHQVLRELTAAHKGIELRTAMHADTEHQRRERQREETAQRQMLSSPLGKNGT